MDTLYTSDGCAYTGMSQETVERLRADLGRTPTVFITKEEYEAILARQAE